MRSVKSAFVLVALAALGSNLIAACSADGDSPNIDPVLPDGSPAPVVDGSVPPVDMDADATTLPDTTVTPIVDAGKDAKVADAGKDTGPKDTGVSDAKDAQVVEAGGDAGPPGSPCPVKDAVQQQVCGICGYQTRVCGPNGGDAAAPNVWQQWGFCQAEVANGCAPGSSTTESCGLCGTRQKICQNDCNYAVGSCTGQPANACAPGSTDFQVGLSCDAGGRIRTCTSACTYDGFSECFTPDGGITGAGLTIALTAGGKASNTFKLDQAITNGRLGAFDTCPSATVGTTLTCYQYVQIANPSSMVATVSIWGSKAATAGSVDIDTIMAVYNGSSPPVSAMQRQACNYGVTDDCGDTTDPTSCLSGWPARCWRTASRSRSPRSRPSSSTTRPTSLRIRPCPTRATTC